MAARDTSFTRSALAGVAAAGSATAVFHPVDTVKTILQNGIPRAAVASGTPAVSVAFRLVGGVPGLYRGVLPAVLSMGPACGVRMGSYEVLKARLLGSDHVGSYHLPTATLIATASGTSVVVSALVRSPLDLVKTQMQAGSAASVNSALRDAWARGGVSGLYRGAGLALLRDVPFFSMNLALYEQLRQVVLTWRQGGQRAAVGAPKQQQPPPPQPQPQQPQQLQLCSLDAVMIGAFAQGVSGFATNPLDVLKTRIQAGKHVHHRATVVRAQ
jgi:hypothetical protein